MKKSFCFFIPLFVVVLAGPTDAVAANPFMGDNQNQVAFNLGQGVDSGFLVPPPFRLVPFYFMHIQYSQPTTFFRIPARQSFNIGQTVGFGTKYRWRWDRYSIPMVFLSEDIAVLHGRRWYFSVGAGGGLQAQQNERIGSKWLFQFKLTGGYRFADNFGGELFIQHFSNGNTADENYSYAFYGMGLTYSF